jgi:ABC-type uncharacterized transport system involved in gliding motility auxiliary subunit
MKPLSRRVYAIGAIVLAAVIFVALNIAIDTTFTTDRIDLTQAGLYTVSPGTKHTIENLQEPITLKFFYSKKVGAQYQQINAYATRVHDLLTGYAARSNGKIILQEIDPEPFSPAEDEAAANGLTGAPSDSGDFVYFGLVGTNTIDGKEVIAFFAPEREPYLEYDLTSLIYRLATPKKPVVAVISSLPLDPNSGGLAGLRRKEAYTAFQELTQTYATKMLDANFDRIASDVDVLMIVHPGPLGPTQLYAIDQFVLRGGRALVFVDPMSEIAGSGQSGIGPASDLPSLFKTWGIGYNADKIVLDRLAAQPVQTSSDPRDPVTRYPIWLHLDSSDVDNKDQVTASLQTLNLASVGALSPLKGATTDFSPLIRSSDQASLVDAIVIRMNTRAQDLMGMVNPTGERFTIAARVSGPAKTSFPAGPPPTTQGDTAKAAPLPAQVKAGAINVIVMADTDVFDDRFWVRVQDIYTKQVATPFADNGAFILNAVENLTGSADLISLRTRATNNRPFIVVQKLQAQAQAKFQQEADALKQRLTDTETRLHALEQGTGPNGKTQADANLTPDQQAEIGRFKHEMAATRGELREVQHSLRKEVDALGAFLAFVNIALVPILVAAFAIVVAILRRRRRARALAL